MCRCDERLKTKTEGTTRLVYTGFHGGLEHLKIETRPINEIFVSVTVECDLDVKDIFCVYYESRKRELKRRLINEGRYDERLQTKS